MALYHTFMGSICFLYLLIIHPHICFTTASKKRTGFSLQLIHRDSPESPLYPGNDLTFQEKMSRYAKWSEARASYLASIVTRNATTVDAIARPPIYADGNYYMVSLGIGTPKQNVMLLLDTGADLTWTQCLPCESCYYQKKAIYNSINSRTFDPIHCDHPLCKDILKCTSNLCWYDMYYGSGSHTTGLAMNESLTFVADDGEQMVFTEMLIGCSKNNQNFPFGTTGNIGGIMGLNPSPHSIVSQLDGMIHRKFSYCLSPDPRQSTYLRFGTDVVVRGPGPVQSTPFVRIGNNYYYGLNLRDISIGGRPINYPAGTFAPKARGRGGCFIDSGAPLTVIEQPAFNTFIAAFENFFAPTGIVRDTRDCPNPNMYCYFTQGIREYPTITLHFPLGVNYTSPPGNYIAPDRSGRYFMLMIAPADRTVLGAWQQHNVRLVYDLNEGNLYFVPEDCNRDV